MSTLTCQVWRLELHDPDMNSFKQYTAILSPQGHALFGFSRIGAKWQWSIKGPSASAADIVVKTLSEKTRKGYYEKWHTEVMLPSEWLDQPVSFAQSIQDALEKARLEGRTDFGTDVPDEHRSSPLSSLITQARGVMAKMADDTDSALIEYGRLQDEAAAVQDDLDVVRNYIDTLQLMLAGAGKGAA